VPLSTSEVSNGGKVIEVRSLVSPKPVLPVTSNAGGNYTGEATTDMITIGMGGTDYVTGGGHIVLPVTSSTNGYYAAKQGSKVNFGMTMKWNKTGRSLQGQINIIYRRLENGVTKLYQIKSNAINSLSVDAITGGNLATINTKAEFTDVTDPSNPKLLLGNNDLTVIAFERSNSTTGTLDEISFRLVNPATRNTADGALIPAGVLFTNALEGANTVRTKLSNGKNNVRSASAMPSSTIASTETVTQQVLIRETPVDKLSVTAYPNPSASQFNLRLSSDKGEAITIRIVNGQGSVIETRTNIVAGQAVQLGAGYKPGMYYVEVMQGNNKKQLKLVKGQQ
jgi:hypothetical protein